MRIEPGREALAVMGLNRMDDQRSEQVVQEAFIEAGAYTPEPRIAERLAPLSPGRSARRSVG